MKIKLAILEQDKEYLQRIVTVFSTRFGEKFELYSFTDEELALKTVREVKMDVLVADASFDINTALLPKQCSFAYFVESAEIESYKDEAAISKYQKAELIYKQILSLYAERIQGITGLKIGEDPCKVFAFGSVAGGTGASTMAAACAYHFAQAGHRVLYLNMERYGSADLFFHAGGQLDMSDVVFALKEQKANFRLKLESAVRQDPRGVYFFSKAKIALDMMELSLEERQKLLRELKLGGSYDIIILDGDFSIDDDSLAVYRGVHGIVLTVDGSEIGNDKFLRMLQALQIKEENSPVPIMKRMYTVYNKFSNKTGQSLPKIGIRELGGVPRYEHAGIEALVETLAEKTFFEELLKENI